MNDDNGNWMTILTILSTSRRQLFYERGKLGSTYRPRLTARKSADAGDPS